MADVNIRSRHHVALLVDYLKVEYLLAQPPIYLTVVELYHYCSDLQNVREIKPIN